VVFYVVTNNSKGSIASIFRVRFSERVATTYKTTRRHKPENHDRHLNGRDNLKPQDEILIENYGKNFTIWIVDNKSMVKLFASIFRISKPQQGLIKTLLNVYFRAVLRNLSILAAH
jgi:hypothetical protein